MKLLLPLLFASVVMSGCSLLGPGILFGGKGTLDVWPVAEQANGDTPIAVDLVVVYDAGLEKQLETLAADAWFATEREKIVRAFPKGAFQVFAWEWVPGQVVGKQPFRYRRGARSTFVFASYATPGEHRWRVKPNRSLVLFLDRNDLRVEPAG